MIIVKPPPNSSREQDENEGAEANMWRRDDPQVWLVCCWLPRPRPCLGPRPPLCSTPAGGGPRARGGGGGKRSHPVIMISFCTRGQTEWEPQQEGRHRGQRRERGGAGKGGLGPQPPR